MHTEIRNIYIYIWDVGIYKSKSGSEKLRLYLSGKKRNGNLSSEFSLMI